MRIFDKVAEIQHYLRRCKAEGASIGFAPTMGALHDGHLELIRLSNARCTVSVASIFVNPTQFNDPKDLEKYPRMPEQDGALLRELGCDVLFMPPVDEVYPPGKALDVELDFGVLDKVMEGRFRPGHFKGMATVVNRLLEIVEPDYLFMGQKDFQQLTIVRDMLRQLKLPITLEMCPTKREIDGLAMSSRNLRLTPEMRAVSPVIFQCLETARQSFEKMPAASVKSKALETLEQSGLKPDYFEIVDGITLKDVLHWNDSDYIVACTAAFAGDVRLIDNVIVKWKNQ